MRIRETRTNHGGNILMFSNYINSTRDKNNVLMGSKNPSDTQQLLKVKEKKYPNQP